MMDVYSGLEPRLLWRHFAALCDIPRASGHEALARAYVERVAAEPGADFESDAAGNIVVRVRARNVSDHAPVVAIQAHLDMVCEKRPDVEHDFLSDPIRPVRRGDSLFAVGTTLGADNGIGVAAALALLTTPDLVHGPLELVFTVEEETGLFGAMALDLSRLQAGMLINLDSEDPDELTIGCAGGAGTSLHLPLARETAPQGVIAFEIAVSGLQGGHSGVQIHEPLANAIKLLTRVLIAAERSGIVFRLSSIDGGSAHNAIPREAKAQIVVAPKDVSALNSAVENANQQIQTEWNEAEPNLCIERRPTEIPESVMGMAAQKSLLHLLYELPHGVQEMSEVFLGKVQTSTNLSRVETREQEIEIAISSRSFVAQKLDAMQQQIRVLGECCGARVEVRDGYPGWEPDADSHLLRVTRHAYETVYGKLPRVEVVHAGLECGVLVAKKPTLEAISFGPLIRGAHSPDEHVVLSTVGPIWKLLTAVLEKLA